MAGKFDVYLGYSLTIFSFIVLPILIFLSQNLFDRTIFGLGFILSIIRFYFGSKNIKVFEFKPPFNIKLSYYNKGSRRKTR